MKRTPNPRAAASRRRPKTERRHEQAPGESIAKAPTGIAGLDEITGGGLPRGRPTLVCGSAGCGKTMLAAEFLVRGALEFGEPGVFMTFEESAAELTDNMRSLGFDLDALAQHGQLRVDYVRVERSEIEETGDYDLEGLFIRLGHAIDSIGAKRVVLDTIEALFAGIPNHAVLRAELRRLFRWLKDRGMTAIITGERGEHALTRYGLEEYVADCVILLDHRIVDEISTRRLRIVKYRGSAHGTNEYPFLISERGVSVLPITSLRLNHAASNERVPTGIAGLDEMLGGRGYFRGSSVLVTGSPGTGKSSVAASFVDVACRRGERALYFAYEESEAQLVRNMASIGIDLARWQKKGLLTIQAARPSLLGLEQHLSMVHDLVLEHRPSVVVIDPVNNLASTGNNALKPMLTRMIDYLKTQGATALFTSLTAEGEEFAAESEAGVSSLTDTWIVLSNQAYNGERTRMLQVLKSRGMPHSNQLREFVFGDHGIALVDVYVSGQQVLTGTARTARMHADSAAAQLRVRDQDRRLRALANHRKVIDAQIAALVAEADDRKSNLEFDLLRERSDDDLGGPPRRRGARGSADGEAR